MDKSKKVAVIGYGYVGKAVAQFFARRHEVMVYDPHVKAPPLWDQKPNKNQLDKNITLNDPKEINKDCSLAVICVPTQMLEDGTCDTSIVEESLKWLEVPLILIKSTVVPGTTDRLREQYKKRLVFSPEYIGEGSYYTPEWKYPSPTEMVKHPFQIFGGNKKDTSEMVQWFVRIMGPHVFFYQVDSKTAELIKYWENMWGAMKVVFCNEMCAIAEAIGVDYYEAREGWALDSRVEKMHSAVFQDARGFGGKCFPKDCNALIKVAEQAGYDAKLLKQVMQSNDEFVAGNDKDK